MGQKAKRLRIYDLSGSDEWVWDRYQPYASEALIDPTGASEGRERLYRGGSWAHEARLARVTRRKRVFPETYGEDIGLRLFRTVP